MHVQSVQIYCFSLSNIQIYDVLIASSSWLRKLPNDLLLCVYVVVKTLNLEISRCHLADYVKRIQLKCVPHVQHDYFSSFNQSDQCFLASSLQLTSSFLKLSNNWELQRGQRRRKRERHLSENVTSHFYNQSSLTPRYWAWKIFAHNPGIKLISAV